MEVIRHIQNAASRWRLILIVYLFQLILALTLGLQVFQVIEASIGNSLSLEHMIPEFNYAALQDLLNVHGASISPLIGKVRWYVIAYILFAAFINAGIWYQLPNNKEGSSWMLFWEGGAKFFGRFLFIGISLLLLFVIWTAIIWGWYGASLFGFIENWFDDRKIIWLGIGLFILWMHGITYLFLWSSFAKAYVINENRGGLKALATGFKFAGKRYFESLPSLYLFALLLALIYYFHFWLEQVVGIESVGLILIFLLIQQGVVWIKLVHRIGVYEYVMSAFLKK